MRPATSYFTVGLLAGALACSMVFSWIGQREKISPGAGGQVITIAHALPVEHPVHAGIEEFGRELSRLSGGALTVDIFPAEQLGNETVCLEKVQQGGIDITKVSTSPIGNFVPVFKLFSLPYLFRDERHLWKVLDGEIGGDLLEELESMDGGGSSGLVGLTWYDAGSRSFYASRPLKDAADLAGLKIRVQQDQVAEDTVKSLGASAVTMSFGELYTSLKQGGVDGAENNPPSFFSSRHFEVCKHYLLDEHSRVPDVLVASGKFWDGLSDTERRWVLEAARRSGVFQRGLWAEETRKSLESLAEAGVEIVTADPVPFRELSAGVLEKHATGGIRKYVDLIRAVK